MEKLSPISLRRDICERVAARYGLDFTVNSRLGTIDERDEYRAWSSRDASSAEVNMWERLVPWDLQELINNVWQALESDLHLETTVEEVASVEFMATVYLSPQDVAVLRQLKDFNPNLERESLLDGLIGTLGHTQVYVSRMIPQGYYHSPKIGSLRTGVLHPWRPEVREVRPEISDYDRLSVYLQPLVASRC